MVKYIEYKKVTDEFTTHQFRGGSEDVVVTEFTGNEVPVNIVSIVAAKESDIDELVASQNPLIECKEIVYAEFKALVKNSIQIANINRQVKEEIAVKYSIEDEIAMLKKDNNDTKRVAYEAYVKKCIEKGDVLKSNLGY